MVGGKENVSKAKTADGAGNARLRRRLRPFVVDSTLGVTSSVQAGGVS
jgi:hypothetical protein